MTCLIKPDKKIPKEIVKSNETDTIEGERPRQNRKPKKVQESDIGKGHGKEIEGDKKKAVKAVTAAKVSKQRVTGRGRRHRHTLLSVSVSILVITLTLIIWIFLGKILVIDLSPDDKSDDAGIRDRQDQELKDDAFKCKTVAVSSIMNRAFPSSKPSEHYNPIHNFTAEELSEIKESEDCGIRFLSWNIADGKAGPRNILLREIVSAFSSKLIMFQELKNLPHNRYCLNGVGGKEDVQPISKGFQRKYGLSDSFVCQVSKDPSGGYYATLANANYLLFEDVPSEVMKIRDEIFPGLTKRDTNSLRLKILISCIREKESGRQFLAVNVHSPRGDMDFNRSVLRLVSSLHEYNVMWAGDFNDDLESKYPVPGDVVIVGTREDQVRGDKRIDFVGFGNISNSLTLADVRLFNTIQDMKELFTEAFLEDIEQKKDEYFNSKTLNHPLITGNLRFKDGLGDLDREMGLLSI